MKRLIVGVLVAVMTWGLATTAMAEHGSMDPFRPRVTVAPAEHGSIDPFNPRGK
ncbi:MAG TPA: hypothetical protein VD902_10685 [Symbiobacteriaceae bacterium]|nr:hypothetical protein [Symbiobacteriaceae bacterium]